MGKVKIDEIRGHWIDEKVVCIGCVTQDECSEVKENELILEDEVTNEEIIYFCDRCGELL